MTRFLQISYAIFLFQQLFALHSYGQSWERGLFVRNISTEHGLSNPTINCFHQDKRGFVWIGTVDGLNRYDGYEFRIYRHNPADPNSILGNRINALCEDSKYNLWIGTANGLCRFNYRNEEFTNHLADGAINQVYDVAYDQLNDRIWFISSEGRLNYCDINSGVVNKFQTLDNDNVAHKLLVNEDELFIGTANNGLFKLSLSTLQIEAYCNTRTGRFQIPNDWITALHYYDDQLFIGTEQGLTIYDPEDKIAKFYDPENSGLPSTSVYEIANDSQGEIYIASDHGLGILNVESGLISSFQRREDISSSLSSNLIRTVLIDEVDNLWIGTVQRGIDYQSKESRLITLVEKRIGYSNSLSGNSITAFTNDDKGGIWIGTKENGLNYYRNGSYRVFDRFESNTESKLYSITDLGIDQNGTVWVSIYNSGLYAFKNGKFERFQENESDPNALRSNKIRGLFCGANGIVWLATEDGLESYDPEERVFIHHMIREPEKSVHFRKNVRTVFEDDEGIIYAGTNTGLYQYNPNTKGIEHFQTEFDNPAAIGHNAIISIIQDSNGLIWIGSLGGGLIKFNKSQKQFRTYTTADGLPDNSIKSIEEDREGNLWVGTNRGLVKINPDNMQIVIYGRSMGLQNDIFNVNASTRLNDGRLAFGGPNGFNVFMPKDLEIGTSNLKVTITDLKLFDKSVSVFGEQNILDQNITFTEHLKIAYGKSKHFSISFSALKFSNPSKVNYEYMMKGFDDNWHFIGHENYVSFTNLKPGEYVFNVRASIDGNLDNEVTRLKISIEPPWYLQPWFRVGSVLCIILLAISFYIYKRYTYRKRQQLLERLVDEKNKEISSQNDVLLGINRELVNQNDKISKQKDHIDQQNVQLTKVQNQLKIANQSLEEKVDIRTRELQESNKNLDKTVKELDRFVYSASHDLSAPLKSILGLVNIAKQDDKEGNVRVHLDYIEGSIIKQENIIRNLIQYSRNARQAINTQLINLHGLTDQIIVELKYLPGSQFIEIMNNVPVEQHVVSDKQRVAMVLNNLISNGIKYRDVERKDSFVSIDFSEDDKSWRLEFVDNGQGIAEDQQEKIFEMFHRANEDSEGSGLGLFIVSEAVDRLGGTISVESNVKKGSIFRLEFPKIDEAN